jgi:hypothetical protein
MTQALKNRGHPLVVNLPRSRYESSYATHFLVIDPFAFHRFPANLPSVGKPAASSGLPFT